MSPVPPAVSALADDAPALHERLQQWAAINSGSTHLAGLARMAGTLRSALQELTADVALRPVAPDGRAVVHARLRPQAPIRVLCSGHYDTVYEAASPFQACTALGGGRVRGPGVADMKGGLVVMLAALRAFEATPHAEQLGWEVLLTPDEEIGSAASRPELEVAARRCHLGLIFEPARENGDLVHSRKGTGVFTVTCHGRAAHAGRDPAAGRNAILALAEYLLEVDRAAADLPGILVNVGRIEGGGAVNTVPDRATAEVNARSARAAATDRLVARLHELAQGINRRDGYRLEIGGGFNRRPMEPGPLTEALFGAWQAAGRDLGLPSFSWTHVGGGSDGNLLQEAGLPCLDGLGPLGGQLHSPEEYVELPSVAARAQLAALVLHRLAAGELRLGDKKEGGTPEGVPPAQGQ